MNLWTMFSIANYERRLMGQKTKTEIEKSNIAVIEVTEGYLREKMYELRGRKVMIDSNFAEI